MRTHLKAKAPVVCRQIRGVTIAELLIVSVLFFSRLSLATMFMMRGKRVSVKTETLCRVQNEAVKLTRKLTQDLNRGTMKDGTGQYDLNGLIFLSSRPVDPDTEAEIAFDTTTGKIVWKQWVAYYRDPTVNQVRRFSKPLTPYVSRPIEATGSWVLPDLPGLPPKEGLTVAEDITEFFPTGRMTDTAMEFTIRAQREVPLGNMTDKEKLVEVEISTMIRMGDGMTP